MTMNIQETLHAKRAVTEDHIRALQQEGREGIRYTATMPDIPFLVLGIFCDLGWLVHLVTGILYFRGNGLQQPADVLALIALVAVQLGIVYTIYMNRIHEKEIATRTQKNLSFGLVGFSGLAAGIIGIVQLVTYRSPSSEILWMTLGGLLNFGTCLPIYLSFKKGIQYGVQ